MAIVIFAIVNIFLTWAFFLLSLFVVSALLTIVGNVIGDDDCLRDGADLMELVEYMGDGRFILDVFKKSK